MTNSLKIAFRIQTRYKWFTLINVTGLALGMLCSLVIFLYVDFHLSTDTRHRDAGNLYRVVLDIHTPEGTIEYEEGTSLPMAAALAGDYSQVETTAFCMAFYNAPTITVYNGVNTTRYKEASGVAYADNQFIELFAPHFIEGDARTALSQPNSAVLSEKQAIKYFGTAHATGKTLNINNKADLVVTGVIADLKKNSNLRFDMLVSLPTLQVINPRYQLQNFTWIGSNNWTFVKLRNGNRATLEEQLPAFVKKYMGNDFHHWHLHLQPLADIHFNAKYGGIIKKTMLWVLTAVAAALIVIVCINYINLSIAQAHYRCKEIGVRKCLGGSRRQLFLQFMTETGIIVFIAINLELLASNLVLPVVNSWMATELSLQQLPPGGKVMAIILFWSTLVLLAGYYPAVVLSGFDPIRAMSGKLNANAIKSRRFGNALIGFQYAIALLLLISTFVIVTQVTYLLKTDSGFTKDAIITVNLPRGDLSRLQTFRNTLASLPGVSAASLQHSPPMAEKTDGGFIKYDNNERWSDFIVRDRWADDKFVATYDLTLLVGSNVTLHDSSTEVLVNETLLRKLGVSDPHMALGKNIVLDNASITGTIVGVVKDFHHRSLQNNIEPLAIYAFPGVFSQVGVRLHHRSPGEVIAGISAAWKTHFPAEVLEFSFLHQSVAKLYHAELTTGKLMKLFAIVSLIVSCIGILGLSVFSTLRRTREIGIRRVLGATQLNIILLLSTQYIKLLVAAFMVATPLAYLAARQWLAGFAYHITPQWFMFVLPAVMMVSLTLLLIGGQSLKATRTNAVEALKSE